MPIDLIGSITASGTYLISLAASDSNVKFNSTRPIKFNIASTSDVVSVSTASPIIFNITPNDITQLTYSTSGTSDTVDYPTFSSINSSSILSLDINGRNLTSVSYVWKLSSLTDFDCSNNLSLSYLGGMPASLTHLTCSNCSLNHISDLNATALTMLLCDNNNLISIPALPSTLLHLDISSNQIISIGYLPDGMVSLISNNNNIQFLPNSFPDSLQTMSFQNVPAMQSIPNFPASLVELDCSGNLSLMQIPNTLPTGLLYLDLSTTTLTPSTIESVVNQLDVNGLSDGTLNIAGTGIPDFDLTSIYNLQNRGWTVTYDQ